MKHILVAAALMVAGLVSAQQTATFGFENQTELDNNFTYTCQLANGSMTIATDLKKTGNSSLKATMGGTGGKSNFLITKASYSNISSISFQLASSDKGKTSFAIEYCATADFGSGVQSILPMTVYTSLPGMAASPSNKVFYEVTVVPTSAVSGYLRFTFNQPSSSGKYLWMDDLTITSGGAPGPGPTPTKSNDATLSSLKYNGTSVPSFSANTTSYNVQLAAGTTAVPTVTYTTNHSAATAQVTNASSLPGTTTVKVTAEDGTTTQTYSINFTVGGTPGPTPTKSNDATLSSLKYNGTSVPSFSANTTSYNVQLAAGTTAVPTVTYTTNHSAATAQVTNATSLPGTTTVKVTAEDGTTTQTYSINFTVASPTPGPTPTTLTLHEPETYEMPTAAGGYGTPLTTYGGREYEVYYINRNSDGKLNLATTNADKPQCITTGSDDKTFAANDGWLTANTYGRSGDTSFAGAEEFGKSIQNCKFRDNYSMELHIKGYSQFSIVGQDNSASATGTQKHLEVYVDGVLQPQSMSTSHSIRRFPITTGEHVIKVTAVGGSDSRIVAFSLQLAYVPKLKYMGGNDSTQSIWQTQSLKPITYYLKNRVSDAELSWEGDVGTGFSLKKIGGDTLTIDGTAQCPVGDYTYVISAKDQDGTVASQLKGRFHVGRGLRATTDTVVTTWTKAAMTPISIACYTTDANSVTWGWVGTAPQGLNISKNTGSSPMTVTINGTPTKTGTYPYYVQVADGNKITGKVIVESSDPTIIDPSAKTILYLYKSDKTGLINYLSTKYNHLARPAGEFKLGNADYAAFDVIVISEDADATNGEVLELLESSTKPVLNMQAYTYTPARMNWGYPNVGSISNTQIHVTQSTHPIFKNMSKDITLISSVEDAKGLMAVEAWVGFTNAVAPKRGDNYTDDGANAAFLHEISATEHGSKYILLPIGHKSAAKLTADGKKLVDNIITYLCSSTEFAPVGTEDILAGEGIFLTGSMMHNPNNVWVNIYTALGNMVTTTNADYDFSTLPRGMYLIVTNSGTLKVLR